MTSTEKKNVCKKKTETKTKSKMQEKALTQHAYMPFFSACDAAAYDRMCLFVCLRALAGIVFV